jgi:hypothetical protein
MSYDPAKFCIKVGDKIPLNEKPDDFPKDHLVVTEVFHNTEYYGDGHVLCGTVLFEIDGSTWGDDISAPQKGRCFKRETVAGWDYEAEEAEAERSSDDTPDFSDIHAALMRIPERQRPAAVEYLCNCL